MPHEMQRSPRLRYSAASAAPRSPSRVGLRGRALLRCGRQRGDLPVGWIENQGRPPGRHVFGVALRLPEHVVVVDVLLRLGVLLCFPFLLIGVRLGLRQEFFSRELRRTLERCEGGVGPIPLHVWLAINGALNGPFRGLTKHHRGQYRHGADCRERTEHSTEHVTPHSPVTAHFRLHTTTDFRLQGSGFVPPCIDSRRPSGAFVETNIPPFLPSLSGR